MLQPSFRTAMHALAVWLFTVGVAAGGDTTAADLVNRLGDPSFAERERASDALRHLGRSAVPALEEGLKSSDAEIRRRAAELLPVVRRSDLEIRYDAFMDGSDAKAPLPGWEQFRKVAGDDRAARALFISIGRSEPALLETLEKDPAKVGAQLAERTRRSSAHFVPGKPLAQKDATEAEALLLVAAFSSERNSPAAQHFCNCLYTPQVQAAVRGSIAARRLLTPFLSRQLDQSRHIHQAVWIARNLGLDEFTENTLKPEVRKQALAAAAAPIDSNRLIQTASLAAVLEMKDTMETTLKPAARQLAEAMLDKPDDPSNVFQVYNLLQTLNMKDEIDSAVRPAARVTIAEVALKPYDQYRFQMALNLARTLKLDESIEKELKPAAARALMDVCKKLQNRPSQLHTALQLVKTYDLRDASDKYLKPAVRQMAAAAVDSGDVAKLSQVAGAVTSLTMTDVTAESLRPAVRKLAEAATNDPDRLNQLVELAQSLGMKETIDTVLKPRARQALLAANEKPVTVKQHQYMQLARTLEIKEGVPFALKVAHTKSMAPGWRGAALLVVAELGDKSAIPRVEDLFTDTAFVGSIGLNSQTIQTELRDVALATAVSLSGQAITDYDFPYFKLFGRMPGRMSAQSAHCFGFGDKASRDAALKKWKEHSAAKN